MQIKTYHSINETLYTETLPNGLIIRVMPKPDFNRTFAVFATDYGGADQASPIIWNTRCSICPTATP